MMVGAARLRLAPDAQSLLSNSSSTDYPLGEYVDPLVFTSALTLLVGVVQIIMGILRLGFLTTYLSDPLVSGFTTGAAVHVFTSQLNKVLGVKLARHEGIGMIVRMYRDMFLSLGSVNLVALGISIFGILFLDLGRTYINPLVKKVSPIPPPLELILVIIGVIFSMICNLDTSYHIKTVHEIPRGFPTPSLPRLNFLPALISDAIPIAVVCYMFVMSMGKLFAKKHKYKTDATQELYAVGIASVLSSFFPVYPVGASLSRSSVCEMSGANTQLYTVFSSLLLLTVILFLGPFLEPLPMCILACIVIVSLKSLFLQVKELPRLWKVSKYDFVSFRDLYRFICIVRVSLASLKQYTEQQKKNVLALESRTARQHAHHFLSATCSLLSNTTISGNMDGRMSLHRVHRRHHWPGALACLLTLHSRSSSAMADFLEYRRTWWNSTTKHSGGSRDRSIRRLSSLCQRISFQRKDDRSNRKSSRRRSVSRRTNSDRRWLSDLIHRLHGSGCSPRRLPRCSEMWRARLLLRSSRRRAFRSPRRRTLWRSRSRRCLFLVHRSLYSLSRPSTKCLNDSS